MKRIRWNFKSFVGISLLTVLTTGIVNHAVAESPANNFKTFAEWCRNKESLSPDARHTIEVLLTAAKTNDCDRANTALSQRTELILTNKGLVDLQPLSVLTHLKTLSVTKNQIRNVQPLSRLTSLTYLALNLNQVSEIGSLSNLTNLEELHLSGNQITNVKPLTNLANLKALSLQVNQISEIEPLAKLTNLETLDLGGIK